MNGYQEKYMETIYSLKFLGESRMSVRKNKPNDKRSILKIRRRRIHPDFHKRIREYSDLLSAIERDYSDERLIPPLPELSSVPGDNIDLWAWSNHEKTIKYQRNIGQRLKLVRSLHGELGHILETVPVETIDDILMPGKFNDYFSRP